MNARRAARELALLALLQQDRHPNRSPGEHAPAPERPDPATAADVKPDNRAIKELIMAGVRALVHEAEDKIETAAHDLAAVSQEWLEYEQNHPSNLALPLDAPSQPVALPNTRETIEKIEQCLLAAEFLSEALYIPELAAHARVASVQEYAIRLVQLVQLHREGLDQLINQYAEEWRLDRLVRMDAFILRLITAEMLYVPEVDVSVSINEAVELAKRFSTLESHRFINGILGRLADTLEAQAAEETAGLSQLPT
jgi:N utilization substance protein B